MSLFFVSSRHFLVTQLGPLYAMLFRSLFLIFCTSNRLQFFELHMLPVLSQQLGSNKFAYAREGQFGLLNMTLKAEVDLDINAVDEDGRTLLHWASSAGNLEIVEHLLTAYKANPNTKDEENWTPVLSACSAGKLGVARRLVAAGAKIDVVSSSGASALHYASSKGHLDVVAFLIEQGASVGAQDKHGDSPLHRAVRSVPVVKLLLQKGASVKLRNKRGRTALHDAAEEGAEEVCKLLLDAGGDADLKDEEGVTPRTLGGQVLEGIWPRK
jgi:26S proteasome non-ATPase regulatory subunit 10